MMYSLIRQHTAIAVLSELNLFIDYQDVPGLLKGEAAMFYTPDRVSGVCCITRSIVDPVVFKLYGATTDNRQQYKVHVRKAMGTYPQLDMYVVGVSKQAMFDACVIHGLMKEKK